MTDKQKERDDLILTLNGALKDVIGYVPLDSVIRLADILIEKGVNAPSEDLINRPKAEIKQLRHNYALAVAEREANVKGFTEQLSKIKSEAYEEFAERLKATPKRFRVEYFEYFDRPSISQKK